MSEKIDQFCENLRTRLNSVDEKLNAVKSNIKAADQKNRAAIQGQLDKAKSAIEAERQKAKDRKAKLDQRFDELKADTDTKIQEWKTKRELKKLSHRADRAEDYAAWSIDVAMSAVAEAEFATLEAIDARLLYDEAAEEK